MKEIILVKYGEIILKGLNRSKFEHMLMRNIKHAIGFIEGLDMWVRQAVIYVDVPPDQLDPVTERLSKIFGIVSITRAGVIEKDLETIKKGAYEYCHDALGENVRFKVEAKRSDKRFPYNSIEIGQQVGGYLHDRCAGAVVDVHHPDITVKVEIRDSDAYVYCVEKRTAGQGGMPIGSGGKATLLLSGGIDSPVAGHMIAKRGVQINAVNFFSFPYTSERAKEKVIELASILAQYTSKIKLYIVPFTEIQLQIRDHCPEEQMTLIMRRFMMRIAERIAHKTGTKALITGESVGQVASQTLGALHVTNTVVTMPVLRPLIGMDKSEIIERAQKIDTFETSILPYEDCCTVFTPKHPTTNPRLELVEKSEKSLAAEELIERALEGVELIEVYPDGNEEA